MEWVETTGRSVEEAKDAALDQLGVDESDAEFVVVNEPRSGLFGRVRGEARVRARVRPTSPRPKRNRIRRQGGEGGAQRARQVGHATTKENPRRKAGASAARREDSPDSAEGGQIPGVGATPSKNGTSGDATRAGQPGRKRRSRGGAGRDAGSGVSSRSGREDGAGAGGVDFVGRRTALPGADRKMTNRSHREVDVTEEAVVGEDLSLEEQGEAAREFIEGLVRVLGLTGVVTSGVLDEDTVQVSVNGTDLGILVGPGGGTLAALQELARTVVQRHTGGRSERILVDVAGYRAKRATALQRFTRDVAESVLSSSSERALEPMSASDRKVVHDAANEIEGVVTRSVGEEPRRYVIVALAPAEPQKVGAEDD